MTTNHNPPTKETSKMNTCEKCGDELVGAWALHGIVCGKTEAERDAAAASFAEALERRSARDKADLEREIADNIEWRAEAERQHKARVARYAKEDRAR